MILVQFFLQVKPKWCRSEHFKEARDHLLLNIMFHAPMERFQLELNWNYFSHSFSNTIIEWDDGEKRNSNLILIETTYLLFYIFNLIRNIVKLYIPI